MELNKQPPIDFSTSMFQNRFMTMFSGVSVKENDHYIMIENISGRTLVNRITKQWKSSVISNFLFSKVTHRLVIFRKFFAIEVLYILEQLQHDRYITHADRALFRKAIELLKENTWLKNSLVADVPNKLDYTQLNLFKKSPLAIQKEFLELYGRNTQLYGLNGFLLSAAAGSGKAQPLYSKIKVPGGWKLMGDMQIGDTVTARDGTPCKVTGVFPQGMKPIYRVTFADGRTTECCEEHLWNVYHLQGKNTQVYKTVSTKELISLFNHPNKRIGERLYIDLPESEQIPDIELPMDPWTLGVLIGDGGLSNKVIHFSTSDQFIIDKLQSKLPEGLSIKQRNTYDYFIVKDPSLQKNKYKNILDDLDLMGKLSLHKFIPREYLHASHNQRLELMRGLLDTDGNISEHGGGINFSTSSEQLAKDVQYLARSLGCHAKITSRIPHYTYKGEYKAGKLAYRVWIRAKKPSELFTLPRQVERTNDDNQYSPTLKLRVDKVELSGYEECQCISIDHPEHLYITDDFIVTHNTLTSLMLMACLKKDLTIIVCLKNTVLDPWVKTLETEFKKPVKFWSTLTHKSLDSIDYDYIVVHYEAIQTLFDFFPKLKQKNIGIILDECHNFNEIKSERTQKFIQLVKESGASEVLPMSGTPVKAMATEMVPMLTAIDPLFEDDVSFRFKKIFGISTARANDIMRNRIGLISYRTEKSAEEYGELEEINYKVELPNADRYTISTIKKEMLAFVTERLEFYKSNSKKYEDMYQKGLVEFEKSILTDADKLAYDDYKKQVKAIRQATSLFDVHKEMQDANLYEKKVIAPKLSGSTLHEWRDAKSVVKYVGLKVRGEALGRLLGKRRAECHVDMIKHAQLDSFVEAATKKTLIFTSYVDVVNEITNYFKEPIFKNRYEPLPVTAETTKNLKQILGRLEKDPKAGPIIATYDSLSTGVPVTAASTVILFNQPFRSYEREQAVARAWRKGQDTPVTVVNIILDTGNTPNISTRSMDIMEWSKEQVEQITGVKLGGSKSNPDNPNIGIEQYIDDIEKTHWVVQMSDLDVHGKAIALNQILDGSDVINEEQMLTDIIPSLEGMFDSAVRTIKKIFTVIDGKDIDKERVSPYVMSKKMLDVVRHKPYHELADLFVVRPEGLNVTYLSFADEMTYQFETLHSFFETVLTPVTQYLAVLASDPKQIGSIRPGEFNLYLKNYDLDAIKQRYSSNFKDGNLSKAYYHQMVARNEDWVKLARSLTGAQAAYLQISPEKVERSVNNIYDILEEIIVRLKTDQELLKLSKVQLKDLTTLAYTLASAVEYYSVLLFSWRVFNQSLKETDKDLTAPGKSVGMEGINPIGFLKSLGNGKPGTKLKSGGMRTDENKKGITELKSVIQKLYLNDAWLSKQTLVTGDVQAKDFSPTFELAGKIDKPLENIEKSLSAILSTGEQWFNYCKSLDEQVQKIDEETRTMSRKAGEDKEKVIEAWTTGLNKQKALFNSINFSKFPNGLTIPGNERLVVKNDKVAIETTKEPVGTNVLPALNKEGIKKAAGLIERLFELKDSVGKKHRCRWLDHSDGEQETNKIYDLNYKLYDEYFDLFYHQSIEHKLPVNIFDFYPVFEIIKGLEKWIDRSIK